MGRKLAGRRKLEEESGREEAPNCGSIGRSSVTVAPVRRRFSGTREGPALGLWGGGGEGWGPKCGNHLGVSCCVGYLSRKIQAEVSEVVLPTSDPTWWFPLCQTTVSTTARC